jgi:hypothetical protein
MKIWANINFSLKDKMIQLYKDYFSVLLKKNYIAMNVV